MHEPFMNGLEDYLSGKRQTGGHGAFQSHLDQCPECRNSAKAFADHARLFDALRPEESVEPTPGFYARVMDRIEAQARGSLWSLFLEPMFAKRLMFASLTLLVIFSTAAVSLSGNDGMHSALPYELVADVELNPAAVADPASERAVVFANLASYSGASLLVTSNE